jgi:hypothetical protein
VGLALCSDAKWRETLSQEPGNTTIGGGHFKPEQIIQRLRNAEIKLASEKPTGEVCGELGFSGKLSARRPARMMCLSDCISRAITMMRRCFTVWTFKSASRG